MSYNRIAGRQRMNDKIVIRDTQEGIDCRLCIGLPGNPGTYLNPALDHLWFYGEEKLVWSFPCPLGEFIVTGDKLIADLRNAIYFSNLVLFQQPVPESGTKIETIVHILRLRERVKSW